MYIIRTRNRVKIPEISGVVAGGAPDCGCQSPVIWSPPLQCAATLVIVFPSRLCAAPRAVVHPPAPRSRTCPNTYARSRTRTHTHSQFDSCVRSYTVCVCVLCVCVCECVVFCVCVLAFHWVCVCVWLRNCVSAVIPLTAFVHVCYLQPGRIATHFYSVIHKHGICVSCARECASVCMCVKSREEVE